MTAAAAGEHYEYGDLAAFEAWRDREERREDRERADGTYYDWLVSEEYGVMEERIEGWASIQKTFHSLDRAIEHANAAPKRFVVQREVKTGRWQ